MWKKITILQAWVLATVAAFPVGNSSRIRRNANPATTCATVETIIIDVVGASTKYVSTLIHSRSASDSCTATPETVTTCAESPTSTSTTTTTTTFTTTTTSTTTTSSTASTTSTKTSATTTTSTASKPSSCTDAPTIVIIEESGKTPFVKTLQHGPTTTTDDPWLGVV